MSSSNGDEDHNMRDVDEYQDGDAPRADPPGSPRGEDRRGEDRNRDRGGRVQIYNVHSLNSRMWDNTRDGTDVATWPESAWAYAARHDFFLESWMLNTRSQSDLSSAIWGRRRFIQRCHLCSGVISLFNVDGDPVSHTHYCTTTTRVLGGFNPETGTVTCSICRVGIHPYRTGMLRSIIAVDGFLGDTIQSPEWTGWDRYHIDMIPIPSSPFRALYGIS